MALGDVTTTAKQSAGRPKVALTIKAENHDQAVKMLDAATYQSNGDKKAYGFMAEPFVINTPQGIFRVSPGFCLVAKVG